MLDLTGTLADNACADVADLIPGLITEGQYCLTTSLELRSGALVLITAAVVQWLSLGVVHTLVRVDKDERVYYPLPKSSAGKLTDSLMYGDISRSAGAVWAHDAPDERSSFARTDQQRRGGAIRSWYGSTSSTSFGNATSASTRSSRRRAARHSVNEVVRGDDRGGCALQ
jgi:hypothetical protein